MKKLSCFLSSLLLCLALSCVFGKLPEDLHDAGGEAGYQTLERKEQSEEKTRQNLSVCLAFASCPDAWRITGSAALSPLDLQDGEVLPAPSHTPLLLFAARLGGQR